MVGLGQTTFLDLGPGSPPQSITATGYLNIPGDTTEGLKTTTFQAWDYIPAAPGNFSQISGPTFIVDGTAPRLSSPRLSLSAEAQGTYLKNRQLFYSPQAQGNLTLQIRASDIRPNLATAGLAHLGFPNLFGEDGRLINLDGLRAEANYVHLYPIQGQVSLAQKYEITATDRADNRAQSLPFTLTHDSQGPRMTQLQLSVQPIDAETGSPKQLYLHQPEAVIPTLFYGPQAQGRLQVGIQVEDDQSGLKLVAWPEAFGQKQQVDLAGQLGPLSLVYTYGVDSSFAYERPAQGNAGFSLSARDMVDNENEILARNPIAFTLVKDETPPVLSELALSQALLRPGQTLGLNARARDLASGVVTVYITMADLPAAGKSTYQALGLNGTDLYQATLHIPTQGQEAEEIADGPRSVLFYAQDRVDNLQTSQVYTLTIDGTPPQTEQILSPDFENESPIAVDWQVADETSAVRRVHLWYQFGENGSWTEAVNKANAINAPYLSEGHFDFHPLRGEGLYYFALQATDLAGNQQALPEADQSPISVSLYDTTEPTGQVTQAPTYAKADQVPFTIGWSAQDNLSGVAEVQLWYRFNNNTWQNSGLVHTTAVPSLTLLPAGSVSLPGPEVRQLSGQFAFTPPEGEGVYEFGLHIIDHAGNQSAPLIEGDQTTIYDTTDPTGQVTQAPDYARAGPLILKWMAADTFSGVDEVQLWYRVDGGDWQDSLNHRTNISRTQVTGQFSFMPEGEGVYKFALRVQDKASNQMEGASGNGDKTTIYDTTEPTGQVTQAPAYAKADQVPFTINWEAQDDLSGVALVKLWYRFNQGDWQESGLTYTATGVQQTAQGTFDFDPADGDGDYGFVVQVLDVAGNPEAEPDSQQQVEAETIYDTTKPTGQITDNPKITNQSPLLLSWTTNDSRSGIKTVELWYRFNNTAWQNSGLSSDQNSGTFRFRPLNEGDYYFALQVENEAGNQSSQPRDSGDVKIVYDTTPPTGQIRQIPTYTNQPFNITWEAQDNVGIASVEIWYIGVGRWFESWGVPTYANEAKTEGYFTFTPSSDGTYQFTIRPRDTAGNIQSIEIRRLKSTIYDTTPPEAKINLPDLGDGPQDSLDLTLSWEANETIQQYQVEYQDVLQGQWQTWLSGTKLTETHFSQAEAGRAYAFRVKAQDRAGNLSSWSQPGVVSFRTRAEYDPIGGQNTALQRDGGLYYMHGDHLGSVILVTCGQTCPGYQQNEVVTLSRYQPYGLRRRLAE